MSKIGMMKTVFATELKGIQPDISEDALKYIAQGLIEFQKEHDALVAQVDALRDALDKISNWNELTLDFRVTYGSNGERDFYRRVAADALSKTPAACLAQVKADAGRAGFIEAAQIYSDWISESDYLPAADQYAERIRQEVK